MARVFASIGPSGKQLVKGEVVYQTTAAEFAACLPRLLEAGASFVGGCCGTDPTFIAALRAALAD